MARIRGEIFIDRPPEAVFDYVADERHEPLYNPRMSASELETEEPIGAGSRFRATIRSGRRTIPMDVDFTRFERPRLLASHSHVPGADIDGELRFEPEGPGTRMRWSWNLKTGGPQRLLAPMVELIGARQERAIWGNLKRLLEETPIPAGLPTSFGPVERASAVDLMELASDVGPAPMQVGAVLRLAPGPELTPGRLADELAGRIRSTPRLRQKLEPTPIGCGRPIWVDDPTFDITRHVGEVCVPSPATRRPCWRWRRSSSPTRSPRTGRCGRQP